MSTPSLLIVGKNTYYWSYIAPVVRRFSERFGRPVPAISLEGEFEDESGLVDCSTRHLRRRWRAAVAFDVWSMIAARALAARVLYVHHSLVGKGLVLRGERPFRPLHFADLVCLPLSERVADLPARSRHKARVIGHVPFDWLRSPGDPVAQRWARRLAAWGQDAGRRKVALLCTHGAFGSSHLLADIVGLCNQHGFAVALKLHGYLKAANVQVSSSAHSFGDCPTAMIVRAADLVITDHSTAALEAFMLGVPCICYGGGALQALRQRYPQLSELEYLRYTPCYENLAQLEQLVQQQRVRGPAACDEHSADVDLASSAGTLLDLCVEETAA